MTILKEFFGLLWTIAVVAFLVGLALGLYIGVKGAVALESAGYAVVVIGGGGRV